MASDKVAGLVLPPEATFSSEGQVFAGFPGVYYPGEALALESLGLTREEARDQIKELDLPLKEARAAAPTEDEAAPEAPAAEESEA